MFRGKYVGPGGVYKGVVISGVCQEIQLVLSFHLILTFSFYSL